MMRKQCSTDSWLCKRWKSKRFFIAISHSHTDGLALLDGEFEERSGQLLLQVLVLGEGGFELTGQGKAAKVGIVELVLELARLRLLHSGSGFRSPFFFFFFFLSM
jgi:hypothetical protein